MLSFLKIKNIALIDELNVEFGGGLNLLTGETGSGKSIIVDSLGALTGSRVTSDLIKEGEQAASIEGVFKISKAKEIGAILESAGVEFENKSAIEIIIKREISLEGRNRVFVNNQLVTQGLLKEIGSFLSDIHGQGEQTALFDPANHVEILDRFAGLEAALDETAELHAELSKIKAILDELKQDDAQKLQLLDILRFQTQEIEKAGLEQGEEELLEEEKRRLSNVEKISALSNEAFDSLYEDEDAVVTRLDGIQKRIKELAEYESAFAEYQDGVETARAVLEDLAIFIRDFKNSIEYSPGRLEEIETRLVEIAGLKRKYGGSVEAVIAHLKESRGRLEAIETSEERAEELRAEIETAKKAFFDSASNLSVERKKAAKLFEKEVARHLDSVALEKAKFVVSFGERKPEAYSANGIDDVEFLFSANPGESPKPVARVASGGEASRLTLILKTAAGRNNDEKAVVFDEVDAGVGGRVAEAVGLKLKALSKSQQILCVTHHPQVASLADRHYLVEKSDDGRKTRVDVRELSKAERLEEIARMLAGETITDAARENAREMLKAKANV